MAVAHLIGDSTFDRWNTETVPQWMIYVIPNTETNDNEAIVNNPDPVKPSSESPEHIW